jgi:hypothetical protein
MLTPSIGFWGTPLTVLGLRHTCRFQHGRSDVDQVRVLAADLALRLDHLRPENDRTVGGAAVLRVELRIRERRVVGDRPAGGYGHRGMRTPDLVQMLELVLQGLGRVVERARGVVDAAPAAVGARAVVARDVDDQGVVQGPNVFDCLHDAADLVVGQLGERREDFLIPDGDLLLVGAQRVPVRHDVGFGRELRVGRDDPELLLAGQDLVAILVPALVELALVFVAPRLGQLNWIVHSLRGVVDEEGLVGVEGFLRLDPLDRAVSEVGLIVVVRVLRGRRESRVVVDHRRVLVRLADHVAVELLEAQPGRPLVERPREAALPRHVLVGLSEHRRAVAVEAQDLRQRRDVVRQDRRLPREARSHLRDGPHVRAMGITPREQRDPAGRADRRDMEVVIDEPVLGEALDRRQVHHAAEGRGAGVAEVVEEDHHHVRRPGRCLDLEDRRRLYLARVELGDGRILRLK